MTPDTLAEDLFNHLHFWLAQLSPAERRGARWVMSPEWMKECRKLAIELGYHPPPRLTDPERLLGLLIEIRDGGGVPHLVAP